MEQFEQLLTCCVCLDRYRIPKLLPCQHSFCMEPCMEGLVDYVRRQVKCPECRAEHRIPYQGVQAFPTNVTLQRFLELHIEITGELPDPTSGQIMERCSVCSEKAYCSLCAHCDKKICEDCKSAHMDILRREIVRINSQVRRGIGRLQESLNVVEKNMLSLQSNCVSVSEEVDEIYRRLNKALKDRADHLRTEIDRYLSTEFRNLTHLKENLEQEITNIASNCDLADKFINESVEWDDGELMDTKEIFLKTVDFIRNFEYENGDYNRRVRFTMAIDPHQLVMNVSTFGDLNITHPPSGSVSSGGLLQPPSSGPGLMRSKSDHRLASQFRQQDEPYDNEPALGGRKFGDRPPGRAERHSDRYGRSGGGGGDYGDYGDHDNESSSSTRAGKSRFRSRFVRSHQGDNDSDTEQGRSVRFSEKDKEKERDKVIDTEDVARGQLSGIIRMADSPRVMKRIQEQTREKKEKKEVQVGQVQVQQQQKPKATATKAPAAARQVSEDDEIARIKRQNKGATTAAAPSSSATAAPPAAATAETERPATDRVSALKTRTGAGSGSDEDNSRNSSVRRTPETTNAAKTRTPGRAGSTESSSSSESSHAAAAANGTAAATTTSTARQRPTPAAEGGSASGTSTPERKPFQSRFLPNHQSSPTASAAAADKSKSKEQSESSEEEESTSDESEEETEEEEEVKPTPTTPTSARATPATPKPESPTVSSSRSSAVDTPARRSREEANAASRSSGYSSPSSYSRTSNYERDGSPKYGQSPATSSSIRSRAGHNADSDDHYSTAGRYSGAGGSSSTSGYGASSSMASAPSDLSRSRSSHALKSREPSPDRTATGSDKDGNLSSWARYLKNKYGNRTSSKEGRDPPPTTTGSSSSTANHHSSPSTSSSSTAADRRRLSLGLPLRQANESSDDDSKNVRGSPTSPTVAAAVGMHHGAAGISPRTQILLQKRRQLFKLGGRGSEPASFTWPRGIAIGPDNSIVVADSSNHRVQVFDQNGIFVKEFGQYGSGEGEFDCLAGVAVNRIGQYIIADRYNHRIQVLDPSGHFLRAFGSQGSADGKFNYPWGVTTDALGFIYVCDKENHRIQVFQSDGTFVGKFGSMGSHEGGLEHPHYIAVSSTNRVIVSDSNNHRIQIFDVGGKVLSTFGSEGAENGQFKFPRGVAVDDQGFICVADSGNNRIQIFHPDGSFLRSFGSWGSNDGEFKGLEGVAIMSNGNILVCDRENHRVQVF